MSTVFLREKEAKKWLDLNTVFRTKEEEDAWSARADVLFHFCAYKQFAQDARLPLLRLSISRMGTSNITIALLIVSLSRLFSFTEHRQFSKWKGSVWVLRARHNAVLLLKSWEIFCDM